MIAPPRKQKRAYESEVLLPALNERKAMVRWPEKATTINGNSCNYYSALLRSCLPFICCRAEADALRTLLVRSL